MMRLGIGVVLALSCSGAIAQEAAPKREAAGLATIRAEQLKRDLTYIASDALEGRLTLQKGDDDAATWVAEQFRKAGLKPAARGADGKPDADARRRDGGVACAGVRRRLSRPGRPDRAGGLCRLWHHCARARL